MKNKAKDIMYLFHNHGFNAYLVGGSIRDSLMKRKLKDIDITTNATPKEIIYIATVSGLHYIETGIKHGTITIIYKNLPIEVTTFRVDDDTRHPEVKFITSLEDDLSRRDFTMNAIAQDKDDNIIDPFNGQNDIKNMIIRAVGNPTKRFNNDPLRVLRAIRFATNFNFIIELNTYNAIKNIKLNISQERIHDELIKILKSPNRMIGIKLLDDTGLLNQILPEIIKLKDCDQNLKFHPEKDVYNHTMLALQSLENNASIELILATLLHDIGKPNTKTIDNNIIHFYDHENIGAEIAESILRRLKFTNDIIEKVVYLIKNHMRGHHFNEMKKSKKITFIEHKYFDDLFKLMNADIMNRKSDFNHDNIREFIKEYKEEKKNRPILNKKIIDGYDIINMGIKDGIYIGKLLDEVNEEIVEGKINTRDEALKFIKFKILIKKTLEENHSLYEKLGKL